MSTESGPELRVLAANEDADAPSGASPEDREAAQPEEASAITPPKSERGRGLLFFLGAVVLLLGIGYAIERGRAETLEGENVVLQQDLSASMSELATAQSRLEAVEARMDVVRGYVADVATQVQLLQEAVAQPAE